MLLEGAIKNIVKVTHTIMTGETWVQPRNKTTIILMEVTEFKGKKKAPSSLLKTSFTGEDDEWLIAVSYTHLDVYKRQVLSSDYR